jgi:hypothetical protein
MVSLSDAIPLRDLERIAYLEETAIELERKANRMLFDAQDMRYRVEAIRERYKGLVAEQGLKACVQKAEAADDRYLDRPKGVA